MLGLGGDAGNRGWVTLHVPLCLALVALQRGRGTIYRDGNVIYKYKYVM